MSAAFEGHVVWAPDADGRIELVTDPLLTEREHVGRHTTDRVDVVVLGRVGGKADMTHLSDAEFVAAVFEESGADFADALVGEFAAAIFDRETQQLHLARDVAGTRPLYFVRSPDAVWFASSIAAVCDNAGLEGKVNLDVAAAVLCVRQPGVGATMTEDVHIVPPGHCISFGRSADVGSSPTQTTVEYWRPLDNLAKLMIEPSDAAAQLAALLEEVTNDLLRSGDVAGTHVTGGIDSTIVGAALAARWTGRGIDDAAPLGFSWHGDPGATSTPLEDQTRVESIAAALSIPVRYCQATVESLKVSFARDPVREPTEMVALEDPVLAEAHANGVTVIFSGWGGDEAVSFRGKNYFASLLRSGRWVQLVRDARRCDGSTLRRVVSTVRSEIVRRSRSPSPVKRGYATPEIHARYKGRAPDVRDTKSVEEAQVAMLRYGHIGNRCAAWSVAAAPAGLQHVYPLLDRRMLELALALPGDVFAVPYRRWLVYEALGVLRPAGSPRPSKDEPSRGQSTLRAVRDLLDEFDRELPLAGERSDLLDLEKIAEVVDRLPDDPMALPQPGRLIAALEVAFTPDGTPLDQLLTR